MTGPVCASWGRIPRVRQRVVRPQHRLDSLRQFPRELSWLPFGNGRSYGDSCLNDGGLLIDTRGLDRFVSFDEATGRLACESGVLLAEILELVVPRGWFPCVTPGTRFVTVGGAIANDVHGKNHHVAGTFGRHVLRFELLRSDGSRCLCSREENVELFRATIGGLGLTGLIQWAEIQLRPIASPLVSVETVKFGSLDDFFALSAEADRASEYTVAWIDCLSGGAGRARGHFIKGTHAEAGAGDGARARAPRPLAFPLDPPFSLVNRASLRLFNAAYYHRQVRESRRQAVHYAPFFYPLDGVEHWNRMYGRNGFFQFQCAIPPAGARDALQEMLREIAGSGQGSFLAVLKEFGDLAVARPAVVSPARARP